MLYETICTAKSNFVWRKLFAQTRLKKREVETSHSLIKFLFYVIEGTVNCLSPQWTYFFPLSMQVVRARRCVRARMQDACALSIQSSGYEQEGSGGSETMFVISFSFLCASKSAIPSYLLSQFLAPLLICLEQHARDHGEAKHVPIHS